MLRTRTLLMLMFLVAAIAPSSGAGDEVAFRILVNPSNSAASVDHKFLLDAFLGKRTHWPDNQPIRPVDLPPDSSTRHRFSEDALKRTVSAVKSYWLQAIFSGHGVPPPELNSDEQVVKFVLQTAGAVGYVSGTANIERAKVIPVR